LAAAATTAAAVADGGGQEEGKQSRSISAKQKHMAGTWTHYQLMFVLTVAA
jgi:hypothetical protein